MRLPAYIWLSKTCLSVSLIIYKKKQTPKLSDFLTAPLPTPGYQQMCYLTKGNLIFQLFPVSVGEHYHCPFCSAGLQFRGHSLEHSFFFGFSYSIFSTCWLFFIFFFLYSATSFHPCRRKFLRLPSVLHRRLLLPRAGQPCLLVSVQLELHNRFFQIVAL